MHGDHERASPRHVAALGDAIPEIIPLRLLGSAFATCRLRGMRLDRQGPAFLRNLGGWGLGGFAIGRRRLGNQDRAGAEEGKPDRCGQSRHERMHGQHSLQGGRGLAPPIKSSMAVAVVPPVLILVRLCE